MKKIWFTLIFIVTAEASFSFEFSPFVGRLVEASPQQLIDTIESTGRGTFSQELISLLNSLAYRTPYYYPYDRLDAQSARQLADYFARTGATSEDARWIWDKIWNVLMIGSGLIYDQSVVAYEADINRIYELAYRPIDLRKSRYENDTIGFARLITQLSPGRKVWLPQPVSSVPAQPAYVVPPVSTSASAPVPVPASAVSAPVIPAASPAKIIPRMPDPSGKKAYRIQVGSYLGVDFALDTVTRLRQVGFSPAYEINGEYYRVVIPGIPASDMPITAQLLGTAGFKEAWVREEW